MKLHRIKAFFRGMGSVLFADRDTKRIQTDAEAIASDRKAIASDWKAVGKDVETALRKFKEPKE